MMSHLSRLLQLWSIAAKHRLDVAVLMIREFNFAQTSNQITDKQLQQLYKQLALVAFLIRLHPASWFKSRKKMSVSLACEEMGVLFLKLGQLVSTRSDFVPQNILDQLACLQDKVTPFATADAMQAIEQALPQPITEYFSRFDEKPLAAASIAQVHTASFSDGREVIVKVVRPNLKNNILADFAMLQDFAVWLESREEAARALHMVEVVEDYRQVMLNELDLNLEAANATIMRNNFLGSDMMYVPEVYFSCESVIVAERIQGVPISDVATLDQLGINRQQLAEKGLKIFFTQLLRDNFFHADMHPGNVFVETINPQNPRYIGLDCAIIGELSEQDRLIVARLLLSVMQKDFTQLVNVVHHAGWIPPTTDQYALSRDMKRTVGPMVSKPIYEIDFASVMMNIMDVARRHRLDIPPQLMLLIKTLVHVEGLGRELYPELDIWNLAKPMLADWLKQQVDPKRTIKHLKTQLPDILVGAAELPKQLQESMIAVRRQSHWQSQQLREIQAMRSQIASQGRNDWFTLAVFFGSLVMSQQLPQEGAMVCYAVAVLVVVRRLLK